MLTAQEKALSKIFGDEYVFTIPGYQRPYAWGKEQASELLDDLLQALGDAPQQLSDSAPYFLGSIVLIKNEALPDAKVVDGQQRLTTLTLLLSAIRSVVKDPAVQAGITKRIYEHGDVVSATPPSYRLSLRERDREFFRSFVQHEDGLAQLLSLTTPLYFSRNLALLQRLFLVELTTDESAGGSRAPQLRTPPGKKTCHLGRLLLDRGMSSCSSHQEMRSQEPGW